MGRRLVVERLEERSLLAVVPLTVTLNQASAQADPAATAPVHFNVVFSQPVSDFTAEDVTLAFTRYHLTDLGTLGGNESYAWAINDAGQIVGEAVDENSETHAFLYDGSTMVDLGTLGGTESHAQAINNVGQIVGYSTLSDGSTHAFLFQASTMTDLGTLGGDASYGQGISSTGQVVGSSTLSDGSTRAFLFEGSTMTDLGAWGGTQSTALDIAGGKIAGYYRSSDGNVHPVLFDGTTATDLGGLGGSNGMTSRLNDNGQVVGFAQTADDAEIHAFLSNGSTLTDLGTLGGTQSFAQGINNAGWVVGYSLTSAGENHGFLDIGSSMVDLNRLLDASGSGWSVNAAWDVNSSGQIAAFGVGPSGNMHAVLLTPVSAVQGALSVIVTASSGDGTAYDVAVSGMAGQGLVSASLAAGVAHDADNNANEVSISTDNLVFFQPPLTVTVDWAPGQTAVSTTDPIHFTVAFSDPVSDFGASNLTLGGTAGGSWQVLVTPLDSTGETYDVAVTGLASSGTVTVGVAAGKVYRTLGDANEASTPIHNEVTYQRPDGPGLAWLSDVTVYEGAPLNIALDGNDLGGGPLTYTVSSDNPALTTVLSQANRSLLFTMDGFGQFGGDGQMVFQLFEDLTPLTTARIIALADSTFYDGLTFHRIIKQFMIQGGDPSGDGTGGTGTTFNDEFNAALRPTSAGVLAMANSGTNTNDSQFFITDVATRWLDFKHTVFGFLTEGDYVRQLLQNVSTDSNDAPLTAVHIKTVRSFLDTQNAVLRLFALEGTTAEGNVTVTATDAQGRTISRTFHVNIAPDPNATSGLNRPAAPTSIQLLAGSDTGSDQADGLTSLDNSAGHGLTFRVSGVQSGALVTLYADGRQIGQATAGSNSVDITTDGQTILGNGAHRITAIQTLLDQSATAGGELRTVDLPSEASAGLQIVVDTLSPTVNIVAAAGQTDPSHVSPIHFTVTFSEPVSDFTSGDVTLGGTAGNSLTALVTPVGDGTTYDVAVSVK